MSTDTYAQFIQYYEVNHPELINIIIAKTSEEFNKCIETLLEAAIYDLEKDADKFCSLDEDGLSTIFIYPLRKPGLSVTREERSKGHVDITIKSTRLPIRVWLIEAKIYDGPVYHVDGLKQLVEKYTTGREGSVGVLEYVKKPNLKDLVEKIKVHMNKEKPCEQDGNSVDHPRIAWAFSTNHKHSSGEKIRVLHLSCNLFVG